MDPLVVTPPLPAGMRLGALEAPLWTLQEHWTTLDPWTRLKLLKDVEGWQVALSTCVSANSFTSQAPYYARNKKGSRKS